MTLISTGFLLALLVYFISSLAYVGGLGTKSRRLTRWGSAFLVWGAASKGSPSMRLSSPSVI